MYSTMRTSELMICPLKIAFSIDFVIILYRRYVSLRLILEEEILHT